jgi:antirestriction protein ArdC
MSERADLYERVTNQILEAMEKGEGRFRLPWHQSAAESVLPLNAVSRIAYRGVNAVSLWAMKEVREYRLPVWATYKQWQELGAQVRKEEKASLVVYWKVPNPRDEATAAEEAEESDGNNGRRFFARGYSVFNADQVDGYTPPVVPELSSEERIERADAFFRATGADIRHGGVRAFYERARDFIAIPRFELFREASGYYATLAHELTHWTAAKNRLDRDLSGRFGSAAYAAEELVADLGAAFVCASLSITSEPRPDHAEYLAGWLKLLKDDKRAIFTAASKAQQAADYLHSKQGMELAA